MSKQQQKFENSKIRMYQKWVFENENKLVHLLHSTSELSNCYSSI